ncbi:unnamed protein product [Nyctereutes procyonoides]|uniref:Neuromodulin n=1 Tax=Nyctereutes procyonoides TaxID=34880 RepID=A0A811Z072_NYCPR|nr:unnamed protein product [Nyctereutes procyonoides]
MCFWEFTHKNHENQKIEQDDIKPEDKAHKASAKIQANFHGHIIRKKLKGEKKGDAQAAESEANRRMKLLFLTAWRRREKVLLPQMQPLPPAPSLRKLASEEEGDPPGSVPSEEEPSSAETESATKASTNNWWSSEDTPATEVLKQTNVPATLTATAQPPVDAVESSQAEEKESAWQDEGKGEENEME